MNTVNRTTGINIASLDTESLELVKETIVTVLTSPCDEKTKQLALKALTKSIKPPSNIHLSDINLELGSSPNISGLEEAD